MPDRRTAIATLGLAWLVGACAPTDTAPAATVVIAAATPIDQPASSRPLPTSAPRPTVSFVTDDQLPALACGGDVMSGSDIDYAPQARGTPDIAAATIALRGVAPTDTVLVSDTNTTVVRNGTPIWRGHWVDFGRGYLLDSTQACQDAGIGAVVGVSLAEHEAIERARAHTSLEHVVSATNGRFEDLDANDELTGSGYPISPDHDVWAVTFEGVEEVCGGPPPGACRTMALTVTVFPDATSGDFLSSATRGTAIDATAPTPSAPADRRIECGSVTFDRCAWIVAQMRRGSSAASSSPLAVLDVGGEKAVEMYGTANPILVAFQPATGDNNWMTPPTWVVTGDPFFSTIQEWRHGALPDEFVDLLKRAGMPGV
jgi:hypothetical protein